MERESINSIIEHCDRYWGSPDDNKTRHFKEVLPDFLNEFEDDEKDLIISLIKEFDYYSHSIVNESLIELYRMQLLDNQFNEDYAIYCVLKAKGGRINSSTEYLNAYRMLNGISKYSVYPDITDISNRMEYIKSVVLIDDYCGSGESILCFIENNLILLSGKRIIYVVVHIMEEAIAKIQNYSKEKSIDISIVSMFQSKKAFIKRPSDVTRFKAASNRLGVNKDKLGYAQTEALVSFYNDTPNNTLGVFWKNTNKNTPLFPRNNDKRPAWLDMKEKRESRQRNNYNLEVKNAR